MMKRKLYLAVFCCAANLGGMSAALAVNDDEDRQFNAFAADEQVNSARTLVNIAVGQLNGSAREYVYDTQANGRKLSELDWSLNNVPIIKADIALESDWLTLNLRGHTTLSSRRVGAMNDYDWLNSNQAQWTDWSSSPDTHLRYANEFDINAKAWALNQPNYRLGGVAGYQQTRFSWKAYGGSYRYDNGTKTGEFPSDKPVIAYRQTFKLPYFGMAAMYRYKDLEFNALLKYSPWVNATDNDDHYLRATTFKDTVKDSEYYGAIANVGYYITPNVKLFTEWSWSKVSGGQGGTQQINDINGVVTQEAGDPAGMANRAYSLSVGLQYTF
jgi:plasminogen activator